LSRNNEEQFLGEESREERSKSRRQLTADIEVFQGVLCKGQTSPLPSLRYATGCLAIFQGRGKKREGRAGIVPPNNRPNNGVFLAL
jgi:hypothetical protein